jgi:hypothetical protein
MHNWEHKIGFEELPRAGRFGYSFLSDPYRIHLISYCKTPGYHGQIPRGGMEEKSVISNCANPACAVPLLRLRDGRLFQFEVKSTPTSASEDEHKPAPKVMRQVAHFWLCGECSSHLTLSFDQLRGVTVSPLPTKSAQRMLPHQHQH